jgi:hypothetical protein
MTDTLPTFGGHVQKNIDEAETKAQAAHDKVHRLRAELRQEKEVQEAHITKNKSHLVSSTASASAAPTAFERHHLPGNPAELPSICKQSPGSGTSDGTTASRPCFNA